MRIQGIAAGEVPAKVAHIYQKSTARYGRVPTPLTALAHCPDVMETLTALSGALTSSTRVEPRLKTLACLRAAQIAGCPFWVDMNSAVGRTQGLSDEQLADLASFEGSSQFSPKEKALLRYAEGMTRTPALVSDEVFRELASHFDTAQIVELTAMIALENFRSRFNRALAIESDSFCPLPANHPVRTALAHAD